MTVHREQCRRTLLPKVSAISDTSEPLTHSSKRHSPVSRPSEILTDSEVKYPCRVEIGSRSRHDHATFQQPRGSGVSYSYVADCKRGSAPPSVVWAPPTAGPIVKAPTAPPPSTRTPNSGLRLPRPGCAGDPLDCRRTRKLSTGCWLSIYYMILR